MAKQIAEETEQEVEKETEEEVAEAEEAKLKLPFPTACIVREMKKNIDRDKIIRKEVKIAMNKFLEGIVKDVASTMNKNPYSVVDYRMFEEAVKPYRQAKEIQNEKKRVVAHLDKIVEDCESVKRDLDVKFAAAEVVE
jgi:membrane carboxypeptidase/penicillin-binding protein PbpC